MERSYNQVVFSKTLVDSLIIISYCCLAHGLLLLNDGVYWDDWIIYIDIVKNNWISLQQFDRELGGVPVGYWLTWVVGHMPSPVLMFKWLFFCSITSVGFLVYLIQNELKIDNRIQKMFVSLVVIGYPSFQMTASIATGAYWVWYTIFLFGCYVSLLNLRVRTRFHYCIRLFSFAVFGIAFRVSSFLVYYFAFLLLLLLYENQTLRPFNWVRVVKRALTNYLDYLCYPFIYFVVIKKLFPSIGLYANYNSFSTFSSFPLRPYVGCYYYFFENAVWDQFKISLMVMYHHPVLCVGLFLLFCFLFSFNYNREIPVSDDNSGAVFLFLYGVLLFFFAAFPYAAVLKFPSETGVDTRHSLLVGLPVGIICFSIICLCLRAGKLKKIGQLAICLLLMLMCISSIDNYLSWQLHWIKDRSVIYKLSEKDPDKTTVFWVKDDFIIPSTEPWHQFYAYSSMFYYAWKEDTRIGLDIRDKAFYKTWMHTEGKKHFRVTRYNLAGFDPDGPQELMTISKGPLAVNLSSLDLILKYWYYKYCIPEEFESFLDGIVSLVISPCNDQV